MRGGINQEVIREARVTLNDPKCAADAAEDNVRALADSLLVLLGLNSERMAAREGDPRDRDKIDP
jgi:hypothetical protein